MSDRHLPEDLKINSEVLEPTFAYIIGRMWARCEHFRKQHSASCVYFVDACDSWWYTMNAMSQLTTGVSTAIHASLFISNHMQIVNKYIEEHLGFSPILKRKELEGKTFRHLAKEVDTSCIFNDLHKLDN